MTKPNMCDPHAEVIRSMIASGKSARQISDVIGVRRGHIIRYAATRGLGSWSTGTSGSAVMLTTVPADFAANWSVMSNRELARHYGRAPSTIGAWCVRNGLQRPASPNAPVTRPDDFNLHANDTLAQICARYGCGRDVATRWRKEAGYIGKPRSAHTAPPMLTPSRTTQSSMRVNRDMSRAGQAADFLRRFGPIFRCTEDGVADPAGSHWRRGASLPLTAAELIERAERKGWDPDAWKRLAA